MGGWGGVIGKFSCVILHLHQRIFSVVQNSVWLLFTVQFGTIQFRAIVSAVTLRCGMKGETTILRSQSSNQSIVMNPSGTKFSRDKIVSQSDLQARS